MANYTTTITNEGAALLASVIANQGTLTFNEFRFSENDYTGQESTLTEGTFLGVFITAGAVASVIDSTTIKASAQFDNSTITGNHDLYSIGIVGTDGNTTALIAVCTTTDPDVIREPLTGTSTYAFNVNLSVSDTSQITVVGTTAAVIYDIDVVDNLTSPATNKPLSANQGRLVADNLAANENVYGAKNLWNIEKWLNDIGQAFTKSGDVYTTTISDARTNTNKCVFSDTDIEVTLSAELTASGSMQFYVELFDSNDNNVGSISLSNPTFTGIGCKVRFNFNNTGTVTLTAPMLRDARIIDPKFAPFAETNLQLTRKTSGQSNENLLDNGWFTVNQRGFTSGDFTLNKYWFDRWKTAYNNNQNATWSITSAGLSIDTSTTSGNSRFDQIFETALDATKIYTASVMLSDGTVISATGNPEITISHSDFTVYANLGFFRILIPTNKQLTIRAVKLELGSVSTLANDIVPNYTTELVKCQRYFERLKLLGSSNSFGSFGVGYSVTATSMRATLWAKSKRDLPTVTFVGSIKTTNGASVTAISPVQQINSGIVVDITTSGVNLTDPLYLINIGSTADYIDLSADL